MEKVKKQPKWLKIYTHLMKNQNVLDFLFGQKVVKTTTIKEKVYSENDLKKAFEAGHDSARLKGSYKSNGTMLEDYQEWIQNLNNNVFPEKEVLDKIKFTLSVGNESQAIRFIEQYGFWKQGGYNHLNK